MKLLISLVLLAGLVATGAHGELMIYEGFSGYTGSTLGNNNGGTGWSGSWHAWNESGSAEYELNTSTSLPQGASPYAPVGGHAFSDTNITRVCTRIMSTALQTDTTTNYYFSYNFRRDHGKGEAGIAFYDSAESPTMSDLFFGGLYDSPATDESTEFALRKDGNWSRTENGLTNGLNYFIVVKMAMNENGTNDNLTQQTIRSNPRHWIPSICETVWLAMDKSSIWTSSDSARHGGTSRQFQNRLRAS